MKKEVFKFSNQSTEIYFNAGFPRLTNLVDRKSTVIITDENVFRHHGRKFKGWDVIVLKPGEEYKIQETVDSVIGQLIKFEADRKTFLVGIGGGVITDITGYVASVYMRGLRFGFVPTSILAMVDASIGGKNGIDVGPYKNLVGTIHQPSFLFYDTAFLQSLPDSEWVNGFAEIIKHSCIKDPKMFKELEKNEIGHYRKDKKALDELIRRNVLIKLKVVKEDEFEKGERRLLNFGHTLGHAIENIYELSHGQAISIGMVVACRISEKLAGFADTERLKAVLEKYGLPVEAKYDRKKAFGILKMDKKRAGKEMNYVLLKKIGSGLVESIPMKELEKLLLNI